jgi:hypothetical protein
MTGSLQKMAALLGRGHMRLGQYHPLQRGKSGAEQSDSLSRPGLSPESLIQINEQD